MIRLKCAANIRGKVLPAGSLVQNVDPKIIDMMILAGTAEHVEGDHVETPQERRARLRAEKEAAAQQQVDSNPGNGQQEAAVEAGDNDPDKQPDTSSEQKPFGRSSQPEGAAQ
jgi:hypothetical protein